MFLKFQYVIKAITSKLNFVEAFPILNMLYVMFDINITSITLAFNVISIILTYIYMLKFIALNFKRHINNVNH